MSFICNYGSRTVNFSWISTTDGRPCRPQSLVKLHAWAIKTANIKIATNNFLINIFFCVFFLFSYLHQKISYARSYEF